MICYNVGADFDLRTDAEKRARALSMLKMLRVGVEEVATTIGGMVGAKLPPSIPPQEIAESGGPIVGGKTQ